jgi:hypothetical protein
MAVRAGTIGGWLAVFATLALLSPGVRVRADEAGPVSEVPQGPTCSDHTPRPDPIASLEQAIELARQQAMRRASQPGASSDDEVVMLNNRGFNYGSNGLPEGAPAPSDAH